MRVAGVLGVLALCGCGRGTNADATGGSADSGGATSTTGGSASGGGNSGGTTSGGSSAGGMSMGGGGTDGTGAGGADPPFTGVQAVTLAEQSCLAPALPIDADGRMECVLSEWPTSKVCACDGAGRALLSREIEDRGRDSLLESGICSESSSCVTFCGCEVVQLEGASDEQASTLWACQNESDPDGALEGVCLIDAEIEPHLGNAGFVQHCPAGQQRSIRPLGASTPLPPANGFQQANYVLDCTPP